MLLIKPGRGGEALFGSVNGSTYIFQRTGAVKWSEAVMGLAGIISLV